MNLYLTLLVGLLSLTGQHVSSMGPPKPKPPTTKTAGIQIRIKGGEIKGYTDISRNGREFYGFAGIEYGESSRFEPAVPVKPWEDNVMDGAAFGETCPQINRLTKSIRGSEKCLYINIFAYKNETSKKFSNVPLPVLVYIHGGSFSFGSSDTYEPSYFMDHDIVFVSFNYRLGPLGFLNTNDGAVRGNLGLKDQVLALKWIQENIEYFGGDKNNVVLIGGSSGASSVQYHLLSPASKGLFHKAISMGGSAISPYSIQNKPLENANRLGNLVKCPVENSTLLVECLKTLSIDTIVRADFESRKGVLKDPVAVFAPTIEDPSSDAFLTEHPYATLNSGRQNPIPWMAGVNSEDGLIYSARILNDKSEIAKINKYWDVLISKFLRFDSSRTDIADNINQFYFNRTSGIDFEKNFDNFTNLFSDRYFFYPLHDSAKIQSKLSPTYLYYYNYRGKASFTDVLSATNNFPLFAVSKLGDLFLEKVLGKEPNKLGVSHLDELPLFFKIEPLEINEKHQDYEESASLVDLWVQFAKDHNKLQVDLSTPWAKVDTSQSDLMYMRFINKVKGQQGMVAEPMKERMQFWDGLRLTPYGY